VNCRVIAFRKIFLTACIALVVPLLGQAQPIPVDLAGPYWSQLLAWHCEFGCGMPLNVSADLPWPGPRSLLFEDGMPPVPMLRGLTLTESQRNKIFMILHSQAPTLRETATAARRAQDDLQQLELSPQFDQAKARLLVDSFVRRLGTIALLRAEGEHEIYALLTDEQRHQMQAIQRLNRERYD
jgi:Spy/CpxP family protein refolding chaperone